MNSEYLKNMSKDELNAYAKYFGAEFGKTVSKLDHDNKVAEIQRKRERIVTLRVLGIDFEIPVKRRMDDEHFGNLFDKQDRSMEDVLAAMKFLLGDEQFAKLVEACTDEDGTGDTTAMAYAVNTILASDKLKN